MAKNVRQRQSENFIQLLRSGDERAFVKFIDKYKETVFLCCRSFGLRDDEAEDVASETFLAAYKGMRHYNGQAELSTWLWSIAYRQAVNYLRRNRRKCQLLAEPNEQLAENKEPFLPVQDSEEAEIVWSAVKRLPRPWATAVILHYREQKCIDDIAKIMRTKKNTVKTYLFRGREKLKPMLAETLGENLNVDRPIKR